GMRRYERRDDFVSLEQQILPLLGRRVARKVPEIALGARDVAVREPDDGQATTLAAILVGVAALSLFVRRERLGIASLKKPRVSEIVVAEHELGRELDGAGKRGLGPIEPSELAVDDADVAQDGVSARIVAKRVLEGGERRLPVAELAERRAEIAEGRRKRRHRSAGAFEGVARARQVVAGQAEFAVFVLRGRPLRRKADRVVERVARAGEVLIFAARAGQRQRGD